MMVEQFLEKYAVMLDRNLLEFLIDNKYESMAKVWDTTPDPLWLIDILKCEANPNYDPALLQYLRFCFDQCFSRCASPVIRKKIGNAIEHLDGYRNGTMSHAALKVFNNQLEDDSRRIVLDVLGTTAEREAIRTVQVGVSWLVNIQVAPSEMSVLYATHHTLKHISVHSNKATLADKLRECLGNPYA